MHLRQGTLLQNGKYRIEKVLGQGGFGITYLAEQTSLRRKVAIKEFFMKEYCERDTDTSSVSLGTSGSKELVEKFREKFVKEAQNIASFSHNNIIKIYEVFEENNTAYYVMDYYGKSLSEYLSQKKILTEGMSLMFIRQIASALSYIHSRNFNHLDVKPGNVLLDNNNNAVLIDFGLTKHYDNGGDQTSSTPVGISRGYAPLEQYKQGGVSTFSPETDIYSLGATLYKLVTGITPPEADEIYENGINFPKDMHLSESVKGAITFAMQPRRKDRPQSIEEFLVALEVKEETEDEGTDIEVRIVPEPTPKPTNRILYVVLAVLIGVAGYLVYDGINKDEKKKREAAEKASLEKEKKEREAAEYAKYKGHDWVDLGLPSGIKWATSNVGASRPEDYGYYFAWGETTTKTEYNSSNSKTEGKSINDIKGDSRYDAAKANWGGSWRLPTKEEIEELKENCTWSWTTQGGKKGYKVTGPNGNSIFLPAAGFRCGTSLGLAGERGDYWSSTPNASDANSACCLRFNSSIQHVGSSDHYYYGRSVRPVSE